MDAVKAEETKSRRLYEKLNRLLGENILSALADDDVTEIIVNADGSLWTESSKEMEDSGQRLPSSQIESVIKSVATSALFKSSKAIFNTISFFSKVTSCYQNF